MMQPSRLLSKRDPRSSLQSSFLGYQGKTIRIFLNCIDSVVTMWIANEEILRNTGK